ncbi:MAG: restriction endonuclease subunit S [Myxococcales bacterium]|nr:restriction endonuclease subunit S [Myxococcales bacterium]
MGGDISFTPLGSLVDEARRISYGVVQPGQHVDDGVPIVRVTDIRHGRINQVDPLRVDPEIADKYRRTVLRGGELLLTLVGTVGETAVVPASLAGWNTARAVAVLPVLDEPGPRWVQYALQTGPAREYIQTRLNTTVQATLNLGDVTTLPIPMPPRETRERILRILGALDDKIELNRKMNATLEAMARALFKSWFVDFDPVRAKAEGRAPSRMDAETPKLFPSELVESELGLIPKGWTIGHVGHVATNRRDAVHPKEVQPGSVYVGLEHLARGRVFFEQTGTPDSLESLKAQFSEGEVLFGKLRPYFKKVAIAPCAGICSTDILVLSPRPNATGFVALVAASDPFIEHAVALSDGTRMPRTSWDQLTRFELVVPSDAVLYAFEDRVVEGFRRAEAARQESATLARLRDELLPRLLSGDLPVDAAERAAPEVA